MAGKTARTAGLALATLAVAGGTMAGLGGTAQAATPVQHHHSATANWGGGGWGEGGWGERGRGEHGWGEHGWGRGGRDEVAGLFRSYRQCEWAGIRGQRYGRWDDFSCEFAGGGGWGGQWRSSWGQPFNQVWSGGGWRYRGVWVLRVEGCNDEL